MGMVKYEEKFYFPQGHIWVLMDDEWGVEILGEEGIDGELVGMGCWEFLTGEAWMKWGDTCIEEVGKLKMQFDIGILSENELLEKLYSISDNLMSKEIENELTWE
jgi:hypothetical protein